MDVIGPALQGQAGAGAVCQHVPGSCLGLHGMTVVTFLVISSLRCLTSPKSQNSLDRRTAVIYRGVVSETRPRTLFRDFRARLIPNTCERVCTSFHQSSFHRCTVPCLDTCRAGMRNVVTHRSQTHSTQPMQRHKYTFPPHFAVASAV